MYVTNYNSFETPIVGNKIRGYYVATVLDRLICNFYFETLRFYGKSNLAVLGDMKPQFCSLWKSWILIFGENSTIESITYKYPNFHFETGASLTVRPVRLEPPQYFRFTNRGRFLRSLKYAIKDWTKKSTPLEPHQYFRACDATALRQSDFT